MQFLLIARTFSSNLFQSIRSTPSIQTTPKKQQNTACQLPPSCLPQHGSYRRLRVYRVVEVVYDLTYHFAHTYLSKSDRTIDQMIQAARSGKQNIAEGNAASTTSAETEIKLTNVAKASLEELLLDYEDYLRVRKRVLWTKSHPRYGSMRNYARSPQLLKEYSSLMMRLTDEELANLCIHSFIRPTTCYIGC